jgi:hypothetical protein
MIAAEQAGGGGAGNQEAGHRNDGNCFGQTALRSLNHFPENWAINAA